MRRLIVAIVFASLACTPTRPTIYTALTGPDPLNCALSFGIENGYTPVAGGTNGGFIRLERRNRPIIGNLSVDVLTVTVAQGQLYITATAFDSDGDELGASGRVKGEAATILQRCGAGTPRTP